MGSAAPTKAALGVWACFVFLVAAGIALVALSASRFRSDGPSSASGVQRLPRVSSGNSGSTIVPAHPMLDLDGYQDYGTVRIGRVERPAWLMTGRKQWVRQLSVPPEGARYEVFVGAIDAPVTVRLGRVGTASSETRVDAGGWTRATLDLNSLDGDRQSIAVDVDATSGGVAAWGSELVISPRRHDSRPDVVLISLDTVRRDQLTPYVPSLPATPALAALANEATVFERAISTSSWTIASHATLFTGRFPPDSLGYSSRVEPEEYTLPEIFAASGYRTFGVSGGPYTDSRWGLHQGFDEYVASKDRENARDATSRAIDWMEQSGTTPAFLFLNYFDAHEPLELSQEVRVATGVTEDVPGPLWFDLDTGRRPMTTAVRDRLLRAYRAELTAIDRELQRLFEYLQRTGRWDRTVIIVWSDHGQLLGERGHIGHAYTLEEELLRVPLIIKGAEGIPIAPGAYPGLIQGDDVFVLSQALAGLPNQDGAEMLAAVNEKVSIRPFAFSKIHHEPLPVLVSQRRWRSATQWAVSDGATKLVRDLEGRWYAYDVSGKEERPIALSGPASVLMTALNRFRIWSDQKRSAPTMSPLSPAERERLRSLGYIQ